MTQTSTSTVASPRVPGWRVALAVAAAIGVFTAILFLPAGRLDWWPAWAYLGLVTALMLGNLVYLSRRNPELIERRMRFARGTKRWDVVWSLAFAPLMVSVYVVAGLDAGRSTISDSPGWPWFAGLVILLPGWLLLSRAMGENPFFEKTVRIQSERGHRVIDSGPYRWVRHPGYLGFFGWILSAPLLLGSPRAFLPALLCVAALVVRTALEDRTLRAELPGYADYARRVRFRLLPGVW